MDPDKPRRGFHHRRMDLAAVSPQTWRVAKGTVPEFQKIICTVLGVLNVEVSPEINADPVSSRSWKPQKIESDSTSNTIIKDKIKIFIDCNQMIEFTVTPDMITHTTTLRVYQNTHIQVHPNTVDI